MNNNYSRQNADKTYFINKRNTLTEKQREVLRIVPETEFELPDVGCQHINIIKTLVNKGHLKQYRCTDPKNFGTSYKLTKRGQDALCGNK